MLLDRVPYGSADSVLQAVTGSPQSAKWLQVGPFCAGSLLVQQTSGRSARMFSALSLLVWVIQRLRRCSARAVLLLNTGLTSKRRESYIASTNRKPLRSFCSRLDAKDLRCKCSRVAGFHRPGEKMCAATGVRQRPAPFYQHISCTPKTIKACRRQKKTGEHAGPFWHKILAPSRCFP